MSSRLARAGARRRGGSSSARASLTDRVPARVAIITADKGSAAPADEVAHLLAHYGDGVRYVDARSGALPEVLSDFRPSGQQRP